MKNLIGIAAVTLVLLGVCGALQHRITVKTLQAEKSQDLSRIQKEYFERVGWMRSNPDFKVYREEVPVFLSWYFSEMDAHQRKYGGNLNYDDYLSELDSKASKTASKAKEEVQISNKKTYFEFTKKFFDVLKQGNYAPPWSFSEKGLRLDILSTQTQLKAGKPEIRLPVILWGAYREVRDDGHLKKVVSSANINVHWKLFDKADKTVGEINAEGLPEMKIDFPERFIAEFPPQTILGYISVQPLPSTVTRTEATIQVSSKSAAGKDILASFVWRLEVPAEWRLKEGETWEGAEETVQTTAK